MKNFTFWIGFFVGMWFYAFTSGAARFLDGDPNGTWVMLISGMNLLVFGFSGLAHLISKRSKREGAG